MPHDELKPKDRVVLRMTRDGAVEENLTEGTSEKVSKRLEDAQLVAPHDTETGDIAEEVKKRRQLRPDELEDAVSQAQAETQSADAAQEYNPGDLPVSDDPTSHTLHSETYRTHSVDYGKAFADTAVTGKVSRPRAERQIDGLMLCLSGDRLPIFVASLDAALEPAYRSGSNRLGNGLVVKEILP